MATTSFLFGRCAMLQQVLNPLSWLVLLHLLLWLGISARVPLRPDLSPDVRVAWL